MTVQQAAYDILKEKNTPMSSRELARIILDRKLILSSAKDPVFSIASTLERNIRDGAYNKPRLFFTNLQRGRRLIGLPSWNRTGKPDSSDSMTFQEISLRIPSTLGEKIQLATQAKIASSFDETVVKILQKGIAAMSSEIKDGLVTQLNTLDEI